MWQFAEACRGPQGRLRRARHPGHRRQRQPLQPDRRDRDPADAGRGGARRHRGRHPAHADRLPGRGPPGAAARRDPRGAVRLGVGARRARPPRRHAARGSTSPPSGRSASCSSRRPGCCPRPTTSPTAAWPRRWSSRACATGSAPGSSSATWPAATRSSRCSASPPAGSLVTVDPEDEERLFELAAEHGVPITSLGGDPRRRRCR